MKNPSKCYIHNHILYLNIKLEKSFYGNKDAKL